MAHRKAPLASLARAGIAFGATFAAFAAAAQIYTWTDKDGRTHYADTPPKTGEVKVIGPARRATPLPEAAQEDSASGAAETAAGASPQQSPPTLAEREQEFRKRREAAAEAEAKAEEERKREEERQRVCEQARARLAALESGQRVTRFNSRGEREFLDDAGRAEELARVQQVIADAQCQ